MTVTNYVPVIAYYKQSVASAIDAECKTRSFNAKIKIIVMDA